MMPQQLAHVVVQGKKILVLLRPARLHVSLKLRKSGPDGMYLEDESKHLEENNSQLDKLLTGKVIKL